MAKITFSNIPDWLKILMAVFFAGAWWKQYDMNTAQNTRDIQEIMADQREIKGLVKDHMGWSMKRSDSAWKSDYELAKQIDTLRAKERLPRHEWDLMAAPK